MVTLRIKKKYVTGFLKGYEEVKDIEVPEATMGLYVDMAKSRAAQGDAGKSYVVLSVYKVVLENLT